MGVARFLTSTLLEKQRPAGAANEHAVSIASDCCAGTLLGR